MDDDDDNDVDSNESSSSRKRNDDDRTNNVNVGHRQNQLTFRSLVIVIGRKTYTAAVIARAPSDPHTWSKMPPMSQHGSTRTAVLLRRSMTAYT